jgi:thiol-disulfide isomerase/thioredoxin
MLLCAPAVSAKSLFYTWQDLHSQEAPTTAFLISEKNRATLADYKGEVVLLNFWASWCPPCIKELPTLEALAVRDGKKGLRVLAMSMDAQPFKVIQTFAKKHGANTLTLANDDSGKLFAAMKSRGLPLTYLIGRDGRVLARYEGATDWTLPQHAKVMEGALKKPSP